ncbi:MAG: MFS transporter [Symploca sp. SIO2E9]|nr:MFS transporter [Symploca sp. SIO2E9]
MRLSESEKPIKPAFKQNSDLGEHLTPPVAMGANSQVNDTDNNSDYKPDQEPLKRGFIPVLKNGNFLTLWSGQVFSQLADKIYLVLMIALIASRFQDANQTISSWVSAIMIAFTLPAVLFGSIAGVFVDRWSKKAVLVVSNLLRGILVLAVPLLLGLTQNWRLFYNLPAGFYGLLGITFLVSTLTQFFAPAEQATIPLIVKRQDLLSANSLYTTTMMASLIVGFAVGEPLLSMADILVAKLGIGWKFGKELVVGGSYVMAGCLLLLLKTGENKQPLAVEKPQVWSDIQEGLNYVKSHRRVRNAMVQLVILFSIFAALAVLAVRLAEALPGIKTSQFGFLLAAAGVGMGCGAYILGHWGHYFTNSRLSLYGSVGMSAALLGLSFSTHNLWLALLTTAFLGGFAAWVGIPMQTTIQAETPEDMRGKVFGLQNNAINIALSLPLTLAGFAETIFGLQPVLLSLVAAAIAGGFLTWYIARTGTKHSTQLKT